MRLFVALNLPADVRAHIYSASAPLHDAGLPVHWIPEQALHVTLKFLGDVEQRAADVEAALNTAARGASAFGMAISSLGAFPSLTCASVIWAGVQSEPPLLALQQCVEEELGKVGFAREDRPFHPHVTLGRARQPIRGSVVADLARRFDYSSTVEVGSVDLMRSHLSSAGARYERIAAAPLPGAERDAGSE